MTGVGAYAAYLMGLGIIDQKVTFLNAGWITSASIQVKIDTDTDLDTDFVDKRNSDYFPLTQYWFPVPDRE
ncbi:MAG: hypothetical protein HGA97_08715 [Chlorobiaceae bacterium]|nr:hypothetical protein [Chlorobiaceae bacterium]